MSGKSFDKLEDRNGNPLKDDAADILMHELVGHAIPDIVGTDTGNALKMKIGRNLKLRMKMVKLKNNKKKGITVNNKTIKIVLILFLLFQFGFKGYSIDNNEDSLVSVSCIKLSNLEYLYRIENKSNSNLFVSEEFVLQQGQDTLWFDNLWNAEHNKFLKYVYAIDTFFVETNHKISYLSIKDSITCEGIVINAAIPKKLVLLKKGEVILKRVYFRTRFITPTYASFRIFNKTFNTKCFNYDKYFEFVKKESFLITVMINSVNVLSSPIWSENCDPMR